MTADRTVHELVQLRPTRTTTVADRSSTLLSMKPLVCLAASAVALTLSTGGVASADETKPLRAVVDDPSGDVEGDGAQDVKDATDVSEVRYAAVRDDRLDKSGYSVRFSVLHARSLADGEHRAVSQFITNDDHTYRLVWTGEEANLFKSSGEGPQPVAIEYRTYAGDGRLTVTFERPRAWSTLWSVSTRLRVDGTDIRDKTDTSDEGIRLYPNR